MNLLSVNTELHSQPNQKEVKLQFLLLFSYQNSSRSIGALKNFPNLSSHKAKTARASPKLHQSECQSLFVRQAK